MNITIIGCGYVGYAVAQYWQQKMTFFVTATTTTPERVPLLQTVAQRAIVVTGNDLEGLKSVLKDQDVVLVSVAPKKNSNYEEAYLQTAKTLVEALQTKTSIKQLIYTSTCSVYGEQNGALVDEETPISPQTPREQVLKETEQILLSLSSEKLHICILRLGGIYGPSRELIKIYSRIAGTTHPGKGQEPINWIHLDDIVAAIEFARKHNLQGIYNLVDDSLFTNREVIERVCAIHNLPPVTWDASVPSNRSYNAKISNQKIKQAGYKLIQPNMIF